MKYDNWYAIGSVQGSISVWNDWIIADGAGESSHLVFHLKSIQILLAEAHASVGT